MTKNINAVSGYGQPVPVQYGQNRVQITQFVSYPMGTLNRSQPDEQPKERLNGENHE